MNEQARSSLSSDLHRKVALIVVKLADLLP